MGRMRPSEPSETRAPSGSDAHTVQDSGRWHRWPRRVLNALSRLPGIYQAARLVTATRFRVEGQSMQPALANGQYLLVNRLAYRSSPPSRGDIVVFRHPALGRSHYVKRIVGLPGEHVHLSESRVLINSCPLVEPYATEADAVGTAFPSQWLLDHDQYFVLGDYRRDSHDSRAFGPVQRNDLIGKAWFRFWPLNALGKVG